MSVRAAHALPSSHYFLEPVASGWNILRRMLLAGGRLRRIRCARPRHTRAASGFIFLISLVSISADAGDTIHFHVARQRADRALIEFAKQAGTSVLFPYDEVSRLTANPLQGEFTIDDGLARLLAGTGLSGRVDSSGSQLTVQFDASSTGAEGTRRRRGFLAVLRAIFSAQGGSPPAANSNQTAQIDAADESSTALPMMIVTGSRIRANGNTQPTPVTIITKTELTRFTPKGVADALTELPSMSGSVSRRQSGPGAMVGHTYLNLRGLGIARNLVLVDGRRVVEATADGAVDINMIPQLLVKRVEVVTGGASAAYGSDAVAGVTNFILDTDFTGFKGTVSYGMTRYSDDRTRRASFALGRAFLDDRLHVIGSLDWTHSDGAHGWAVGGPDRAWNRAGRYLINNPDVTASNPKSPNNPRLIVGENVTKPYASLGGVILDGPLRGTRFLSDGSTAPFQYGTHLTRGFMEGGDGATSSGGWDLESPLNARVGFVHMDFDLSGRTTLYAEALYAASHASLRAGPSHGYGPDAYTIFRDNAYLPAVLRDRMIAGNIGSFPLGRWNLDFGAYTKTVEDQTRRIVLGAKGSLGRHWDWNVYYEYGRNEDDYYGRNDPILENLYRAVDAVVDPVSKQIVCRSSLTAPGNGCVPLNLFGEGAPSRAALQYVLGTPTPFSTVTQQVISGDVQGQLASTGAGPVGVAFGLTHRREALVQTVDPLSTAFLTGTGINGFPASYVGTQGGYFLGNAHPADGAYHVSEVYGETVVPLLSEASGGRLDLNAAVRLTKYSTAGNVDTWKLGVAYAPVESLRLRATVSSDIRAPSVGELFMSQPQTRSTVFDTATDGSAANPIVVNPANPNLREEDARTVTYGLVYTPKSLAGFSAALDIYRIKIDNAIGRLESQRTVDLCAQGDMAICALITRAFNGEISAIATPSLNLDELETRGVDVELNYAAAMPLGRLTFRMLANYVDRFTIKSKASPTFDATDANPLRLHLMASYGLGKFELSLRERLIGAREIDARYTSSDLAKNHVGRQWYTDLTLGYHPRGAARGLDVFVTVENLFDRDPPTGIANANSPTGTSTMYDTLGRYFTAGARFNF